MPITGHALQPWRKTPIRRYPRLDDPKQRDAATRAVGLSAALEDTDDLGVSHRDKNLDWFSLRGTKLA